MRSAPFERILHENADRDKLAAWKAALGISDVRGHLLEQAAEIGYLLWHSLRHSLGLNFKGLSVEHFVSPKTLSVDRSELVRRVLIQSASPPIDAKALEAEIVAKRAANTDLWQIARGHDLVHILCLALRTAWKQDTGHLLSSDAMEGVLRTAYPIGEFAATSLYRQIRSWEAERNGGNTVLVM